MFFFCLLAWVCLSKAGLKIRFKTHTDSFRPLPGAGGANCCGRGGGGAGGVGGCDGGGSCDGCGACGGVIVAMVVMAAMMVSVVVMLVV